MEFTGLNPDAVAFFAELRENNTKQWWTENKARYIDHVRGPFEALGETLEPEFGPVKIYRPNRDVRFSADKSPYKVQIGMVTTGGPIAHYLQLSDSELLVGGGAYEMPKPALNRFREIVDDSRLIGDLEATLDEVGAAGFGLMTSGALKTAPRGYSADHPHIELLRLNRLAIAKTEPLADWMWTPEAADVIADRWRTVSVFCAWMEDNLGPEFAEAAQSSRRGTAN